MANFYTDIPELKYHLNNPMMQRICELKERGYEDKDKFDYAPQDYAPVRLRVRLSLPMPKAWTKKVLIAPTAVWSMPAVPNRTSTLW